ncbi:hypothetical protein C8F04DRAFT_1275598 [Mycena alexandri]|uniref:Uncharacterized protein n=1 Tax=Mycena alexandri TaxID=1745969 RepID=A0AAD6WP78_9AGAR|nr:hypothetical protein C8F04DRAFT_1275598 [Mycena alexandri]
MQIPIPPSASTSVSSVTAPNNPPGFNAFSILDPDNFPEIRYWTRKKFSANDVTELHDDDDNETAGKLGFLEHINGVRFTEEELKSVRKHAYESFSGLLEDGNAPLKWSQASSMASQRVRTEIVRQHPEIALCANNWKVDAVITETYGQWTTRRKEQIAESSKRRLQDAKSKKRKHTEEEEKEREHKRTKRDSESKKNERHKDKTRRRRNTIGDTDNIHSPRPDPADLNFTPDPDDNVSLPADNSASLDLEIGDDPALSLLDSARQSPEPQAAITVVATKPKKVTLSNPLANLKAKSNAKGKGKEVPVTADAANPSGPAAIPATAAPSRSGSPATIPSASMSNTTPQPPIASTFSIAPAPGPASNSDTGANTSNASAAEPQKPVKKGKPYKPGVPDTAWNLWTREYMKTHPAATGEELRVIWNGMDKAKYKADALEIKKKKESKNTVVNREAQQHHRFRCFGCRLQSTTNLDGTFPSPKLWACIHKSRSPLNQFDRAVICRRRHLPFMISSLYLYSITGSMRVGAAAARGTMEWDGARADLSSTGQKSPEEWRTTATYARLTIWQDLALGQTSGHIWPHLADFGWADMDRRRQTRPDGIFTGVDVGS